MTTFENIEDGQHGGGQNAAHAVASNGLRTRRCIASGEVLPEGRLLRFVADPESRVVVDVEAKLPGRGLWVRSNKDDVARAVAKRLFTRAAKTTLHADENLPAQSEARLAASLLANLGLARRAGELLLGFDMIEKTLRSAVPPVIIVEASDGAPDGRRKLQGAARAGGATPIIIGCFSGAELSLALGRANVIHAALKSGRMAERLMFDAGRIAGFRPLNPWIWAGISSEAAPANSTRGVSSFGTS
jgi:predicted RNA-binding protein YlxR (DUF448 family)